MMRLFMLVGPNYWHCLPSVFWLRITLKTFENENTENTIRFLFVLGDFGYDLDSVSKFIGTSLLNSE